MCMTGDAVISAAVPVPPGSDTATGMKGASSSVTAVCCSCKDTVPFYQSALHTDVFNCCREYAPVQMQAEGRDMAHLVLQA